MTLSNLLPVAKNHAPIVSDTDLQKYLFEYYLFLLFCQLLMNMLTSNFLYIYSKSSSFRLYAYSSSGHLASESEPFRKCTVLWCLVVFFPYIFSFQDRLIFALWCISVSTWPKSPEVIHWLLYTADLVAPAGQDVQIVACKPSYTGSRWLPEPPVWVELQSWAKREGSRSARWCPEQRTALWVCPGWHMLQSHIFGPQDVQCLVTLRPECRLVKSEVCPGSLLLA